MDADTIAKVTSVGGSGAVAPQTLAPVQKVAAVEAAQVRPDDGQKPGADDRDSGAASTAERLKDIAEKLNVSTTSIGRKLRFQFDQQANVSVIQVYDRETDRLIRQIPSEEVLERMRNGSDGLDQIIETVA